MGQISPNGFQSFQCYMIWLCIYLNKIFWLWLWLWLWTNRWNHYDDVIMTMLASQITSLTVVYSIVYSGVNQRKHQSSASLAVVREIHRGPVNFPHKWPVTRKMFPFDDVIMKNSTRVARYLRLDDIWRHCNANTFVDTFLLNMFSFQSYL